MANGRETCLLVQEADHLSSKTTNMLTGGIHQILANQVPDMVQVMVTTVLRLQGQQHLQANQAVAAVVIQLPQIVLPVETNKSQTLTAR